MTKERNIIYLMVVALLLIAIMVFLFKGLNAVLLLLGGAVLFLSASMLVKKTHNFLYDTFPNKYLRTAVKFLSFMILYSLLIYAMMLNIDVDSKEAPIIRYWQMSIALSLFLYYRANVDNSKCLSNRKKY